MKDENINKDKPRTVYGVSCLSRFKHTSKLIKGYNQPNSMSRALGFKEPYDGQQKLQGYLPLINFSDVEAVAEWLFENEYDIVKLRNKNKTKDLPSTENPPKKGYYLAKTIKNKWGIVYWNGSGFCDDDFQDGKVMFGVRRTFIKEWYALPTSDVGSHKHRCLCGAEFKSTKELGQHQLGCGIQKV